MGANSFKLLQMVPNEINDGLLKIRSFNWEYEVNIEIKNDKLSKTLAVEIRK